MRLTTEEYVAMKNGMSLPFFRRDFKSTMEKYSYDFMMLHYSISRGTVAKLVKMYR